MTALPQSAIVTDLIRSYTVGADTVILLDGRALVSSQSEPGSYREVDTLLMLCGCVGFQHRRTCRHLRAVTVAQEMDRATATPVERPLCTTCSKKPALVICGRQTSKCGCCTFAAAMDYDPERMKRTGYAPNN